MDTIEPYNIAEDELAYSKFKPWWDRHLLTYPKTNVVSLEVTIDCTAPICGEPFSSRSHTICGCPVNHGGLHTATVYRADDGSLRAAAKKHHFIRETQQVLFYEDAIKFPITLPNAMPFKVNPFSIDLLDLRQRIFNGYFSRYLSRLSYQRPKHIGSISNVIRSIDDLRYWELQWDSVTLHLPNIYDCEYLANLKQAICKASPTQPRFFSDDYIATHQTLAMYAKHLLKEYNEYKQHERFANF